MAADVGTNEYRDRPGLVPWHSRPALESWAARVRMSVGCGSSWAFLARSRACRREPSRVAEAVPLLPLLYPRRKRRQEERRSPWTGTLFPLDFENLMRVRRALPHSRRPAN